MSLSLTAPLQTGKVITGLAYNIGSQRILNTDALTCPVWNGQDNAGRAVCANSFNTTTAGCNLPCDIIDNEDALRPKYMSFVTLNADYVAKNGPDTMNTPTWQNANDKQQEMKHAMDYVTGNFGTQSLSGSIRNGYSRVLMRTKDVFQETAQANRARQAAALTGRRYALMSQLN